MFSEEILRRNGILQAEQPASLASRPIRRGLVPTVSKWRPSQFLPRAKVLMSGSRKCLGLLPRFNSLVSRLCLNDFPRFDESISNVALGGVV